MVGKWGDVKAMEGTKEQKKYWITRSHMTNVTYAANVTFILRNSTFLGNLLLVHVYIEKPWKFEQNVHRGGGGGGSKTLLRMVFREVPKKKKKKKHIFNFQLFVSSIDIEFKRQTELG